MVILAAGVGRRFSQRIPKQFLVLESKPVFIHSLHRIVEGIKRLPEIIVICVPVMHETLARQMVERYLPQTWQKRTVLVHGGDTRIASYDEAVKYLDRSLATYDVVITHDAARPCTQPRVVFQLLKQFRQPLDKTVCITGAPLTESLFIKQGVGDEVACANREQFLFGRTPYVFAPTALMAALQRWRRQKARRVVSDTADILEYLPSGQAKNIKVLVTTEPNPKLTFEEDTSIIRRHLKTLR